MIYPYVNDFLIELIDPDYLEDKYPTEEPDVPDEPTDEPVDEPTDEPTDEPVDEPMQEPTDQPEDIPSDQPNVQEPDNRDKDGCGALMELSTVALCLMSVGVFAWSARKKKKD